LVGVHTSLIFSLIQRFFHKSWSFWGSLLTPGFSQWQIPFAILALLGLPFCFWDPISFGHDYIKLHLYLLQPSHAQCSKFLAANRRHDRHCRRHRPCHWQHRSRCRNCDHCWHLAQVRYEGWVLFPPPAPNISHRISAPVVNEFITLHDPRQIMEIEKIFPSQNEMNHGVVTLFLSFVSTYDDVRCLSSSTIKSSLVVDSGASVCISPHKEDFIVYGASTMKIKDLSSSNNVAGEGIISWNMHDVHGSVVKVEVKGYHMPRADIWLLSPQVLISTIGGSSLQTMTGVELKLDNGVTLFAPHCPHSNLPLLPLANTNYIVRCFWSQAFGFNSSEFAAINDIKSSLLIASNTNLSQPQKEVLLWHQRLSHVSIPWIQSLMRNKKFLPCLNTDSNALHQGPFIRTSSCAPGCNVSGLKCAACLYAKAAARTPSNLPPRWSQKNMTLKTNDLQPGSCISADHYFSPIQGRLPHSFGRERTGYTCGSLFVDHASGKFFLTFHNTRTPRMRPSRAQ
jgi:hypothetical protein